MTTPPDAAAAKPGGSQNPFLVWSYLQFFAVVVVLLMLIIGAVLLALNKHIAVLRVESRADNSQLTEVIALARLGSDLDSGVRGYFLTGSDKYLAPYRDALGAIPTISAGIEKRLANEADRTIYARVATSLANKQIELARNLDVDRSQGREAALALLRDDVGQALMDDLRIDLEQLRAALATRIQARTERVNRLLEIRDGVLSSLILVALLVSLASLFLLRAQVKALKIAQGERDRADAANLANREKSTFLANMSHEIRTPMNAIFGFAQLLKDTVKGEREKFYVQAITQSGQVLLGLINDILDMSKIEAGKLELHPQPTDLKDTFRSCETLFSHMAAEKGLKMQFRLPDHLPARVLVDPLRLRQVLINLIGNAMKYTETGGIVTQVSTQPDGAHHLTLVIAISDTGIGIPVGKQQKIFEPFIQLNTGGSAAAGAGLGLSIVKRIVELMGGTIRVNSTPGKGSTFTLRIPHVPIDATPLSAAARAAANAPLPPLKIVVVDDVELNRRLIEGLFLESPHQVLLADGGASGVALAAKEIPDVVLMDIRMPGVDGIEALRRIRAIPALQHTRVIAATASSMLGEEGQLRRQFDGYLRKPITREMIDAELRRFFSAEAVVEEEAEPLAAVAELPPDSMAMARWREELPTLCEFVTRAARTLSSDDIGALVSHLRKLGEDRPFKSLVRRADQVADAAAVFDIVTLESHIKQLQVFCDELLVHPAEGRAEGNPHD